VRLASSRSPLGGGASNAEGLGSDLRRTWRGNRSLRPRKVRTSRIGSALFGLNSGPTGRPSGFDYAQPALSEVEGRTLRSLPRRFRTDALAPVRFGPIPTLRIRAVPARLAAPKRVRPVRIRTSRRRYAALTRTDADGDRRRAAARRSGRANVREYILCRCHAAGFAAVALASARLSAGDARTRCAVTVLAV
jgi:hypothetical protein